MAANPQVQNALSREISGVQNLWNAVFELKQARAAVELLGVPAMDEETLAESCVGELSHMTSGKVSRLLAAMDVLDVAFLTPVDLGGVTMPPAAALVGVIR